MKDYKYRDGFAYKMYQKAEENLESGVAVEELVENILKEIINAVSFGKTMVRVDMSSYGIALTDKALEELQIMGFKVSHLGREEFAVIWNFSKEDAQEESES